MKLKSGFEGEQSLALPEMVTGMMERDPLTSALHITDMGFYPHAAHHWRQRLEPLDQCILIYCVDGEGWFEMSGRRHTVTAGRYFIIPAGTPHSYGASVSRPWSIYWVHFRGTLAQHYAACAATPQPAAEGPSARTHRRHELFDEIYTALQQPPTIEGLRCAMAAFHHYLASLLFAGHIASDNEHDADAVDAVIRYMEDNLGKQLPLAEISRYAGYSPSRLSAMFRQRTGHSPCSYLSLLRVRHACRLLDTTPLRLNQISSRVGIADPLYFSRLFSKIMGMPPRSWRSRPKG